MLESKPFNYGVCNAEDCSHCSRGGDPADCPLHCEIVTCTECDGTDRPLYGTENRCPTCLGTKTITEATASRLVLERIPPIIIDGKASKPGSGLFGRLTAEELHTALALHDCFLALGMFLRDIGDALSTRRETLGLFQEWRQISYAFIAEDLSDMTSEDA